MSDLSIIHDQILFQKNIEPLLNVEYKLPETFKKHQGTGGDFLEFLMGKTMDNISSPDFNTIELKTKDEDSKALVSLITKSPINSNLLRTEYGRSAINDNDGTEYKRLSATIRYGDFIKTKNPYSFKLDFNDQEKKLYFLVKDMKTGLILNEQRVYYNFDELQKVVDNKLKIVALATFRKREEAGEYFYTYTDYNIIHFDTTLLLELIKSDKVFVEARMGMYKTGKNKGKLHDHGTALRINSKVFLGLNN